MLSRAVSAIYERVMGFSGFTISQVNIMVAAGMIGPCAPGRLGRALHMERSTVSRNIERLLAQGYLLGGPEGSERIRDVRLSARGVDAVHAVLPAWRQAQEEVGQLLGETGVGALHRLGSRLSTASRARGRRREAPAAGKIPTTPMHPQTD